MNSLIPFFLLGSLALVITLLLVSPLIKLAVKVDLIDKPGKHKRHKNDIPIVGGLLLFISLWSSLGISLLIFPEQFKDFTSSLPFVFAGALIITLVGLSDDLSPLSPITKLIAQLAAGLVLVIGGLNIDPLSVPFIGSVEIGNFSILLTLFWVIVLTNAVNLIDGLDGLAGGVSMIAAITMIVVSNLYGAGSAVSLSYGLVGFLIIFLFYNHYPAKIFLGDSGSLQLGYYFAVISLLVPIKSYTAAALYPSLLAFGVPLLEIFMSVSRRAVSGKNIMKADRRHLFHYLSLTGLSPRKVVYIFYFLSTIFSSFALAMFFLDRKIVFGFLILFMVVISVLFLIFMASLSRQGDIRKRLNGK